MSPKKPQCPVCRKPPTREHKPFCSKRCAEIDLGRWLDESYTVPTNPQFDDEDSNSN